MIRPLGLKDFLNITPLLVLSSAGFCFKRRFMESQPFNPKDKSIWYNQPELRKKIEKIRKDFGEPFLITKTGEMLYKDCVVIPAFRQEGKDEC